MDIGRFTKVINELIFSGYYSKYHISYLNPVKHNPQSLEYHLHLFISQFKYVGCRLKCVEGHLKCVEARLKCVEGHLKCVEAQLKCVEDQLKCVFMRL